MRLLGIIAGALGIVGAGYYLTKKRSKSNASTGSNSTKKTATPSKPRKKRNTKRLTEKNCEAVKDYTITGGYKSTVRKRKPYKKRKK